MQVWCGVVRLMLTTAWEAWVSPEPVCHHSVTCEVIRGELWVTGVLWVNAGPDSWYVPKHSIPSSGYTCQPFSRFKWG